MKNRAFFTFCQLHMKGNLFVKFNRCFLLEVLTLRLLLAYLILYLTDYVIVFLFCIILSCLSAAVSRLGGGSSTLARKDQRADCRG